MEYTSAGFVRTVQQLRSAQKEYFATRNKQTLKHSIELEKQVDHYAAQMEIKLKERGMW
jgi:macrodomain Ter protein organizer (MatP/YcbG family)